MRKQGNKGIGEKPSKGGNDGKVGRSGLKMRNEGKEKPRKERQRKERKE